MIAAGLVLAALVVAITVLRPAPAQVPERQADERARKGEPAIEGC